ncbi:hypothetical protein ALGA_0631 [Labilibaculum antarcticum]|uniref:Vitellogenin II n=2 Tax=Labilibaculum antarcticum TaxID=1717717 RepID=A0A1Y1CIA1_9BACT|nr:hypothetical protein ALGA_0631 [Labilibaculum antarcticum]
MGTAVYEDDLYYNPNEAPLLVQKVEAKSPAVKKSNALAPANATQSSTKTIPNTGTEALEDRNFDALQQKYTDILNDESIGSVDTLIYEGDSGYYLGEFTGSDRDQEEAQRLRDMYPQGFGYYDNSGYNTAMWLAGDSDWNVYVDGNNVWWTPTWTNYRFYNDYNFSSTRYGRTFAYNSPYGNYGYNSYSGFNMGFGDSWYWDLNFGWGFSNHYYGSYYPYYGHHGHHGYYGHNGYNNDNYASRYNGKRRSNNYKAGTVTNASATGRTNATSASTRRSSASSTKAGAVSTSRRTTSSTADDIRRSNAAARYSSGNGNSYGTRRTVLNGTSGRRSTYGSTPTTGTRTNTRSNYSNGTTNRTNTNGYSNTRRSSSPSYNKPQTNTRPSYNRSSNSGNSNYSKSATRSSYSKVKSTSSKPTYRSGSSSSSSRSNYSGTRRSSGSSGTTRSSVRSSRSSSGSSGSSTRSSSGSSRSSSGSSKSSNSGSTKRR